MGPRCANVTREVWEMLREKRGVVMEKLADLIRQGADIMDPRNPPQQKGKAGRGGVQSAKSALSMNSTAGMDASAALYGGVLPSGPALHEACASGHKEAAKLLIDFEADPNQL